VDFIVHVEDEYDYMMRSKKSALIIKMIKDAYVANERKNLPIYAVPASVAAFLTTQTGYFDMRSIATAKGHLPPDDYRVYEEDVEIKEETKDESDEPQKV